MTKKQLRKLKVLTILFTILKKADLEPDWISMKIKINCILWNIDKKAFLQTAKTISGFHYYKGYVPTIRDKWFNKTIRKLWYPIYNTYEIDKIVGTDILFNKNIYKIIRAINSVG